MKEIAFCIGIALVVDAGILKMLITRTAFITVYHLYLRARGRKIYRGSKDGVEYIIVTDKDGKLVESSSRHTKK